MASSPWAVTKRKRPSTPAALSRSRKRTRVSEPPATDIRRQQTLTQAQWVANRPTSFQDEPIMGPSAPSATKRDARRMSKRDSTLTQMDFFNSLALPTDDFDDAPLCVEGDNTHAVIPQIDGSYSSPRKPRPRKLTGTRKNAKAHEPEEDIHQYLPSKKRNKSNDTTQNPVSRSKRSSRRLADTGKDPNKVLSDPANNYDYFQRALSGSPAESASPATCGHPKKPVLEIQDSTASNDGISDLPSQSQRSIRSATPRTPQRPRTIVPSSQSPESLPPTTRRSTVKLNVLAQPVRSPLRERSINLPSVTRKMIPKGNSLKGSKIVSLKLPKPSTHPLKSSVEDSQDIWSLPVTSSPKKVQSSQSEVAGVDRTGEGISAALVRIPSNPVEIPDTSQPMREDSEESTEKFPGLNPIFQFRDPASRPLAAAAEIDSIAQPEQQPPQSEVVVRDFAQLDEPIAAVACEQEIGHESPPKTPAKPKPTVIADSESDFDSPVANDTQFNEEVARRISSPHVVSEDSPKTVSTEVLSDATAKLKAAAARTLPNIDFAEGEIEASMLPTPRLIRSSSRPPSQEDEITSDPSSEEGLLPGPTVRTTHRTQTQTTRVPLNDAIPSSSPPLQSYRSTTQRSTVRPASMPHPSQISTQEATQYGLSSMVVDEPSDTPMKMERITIKDSSSMRIPLSQIPAHEGSQGGLNVDLGLDTLDEVGDDDQLDLDPPSTIHEASPTVTNDKITRLASKRKADRAPSQSPVGKKRRTPTQTLPMQDDFETSSDEELDLDPRSSHHPDRRDPSIPHDASESQDFTSKAGTTSNVLKSRGRSTTTRQTTKNGFDNPEVPVKPISISQPPSSTQSQSQSTASSPPSSSDKPSPLRQHHSPLPGFNNETQSNFTQGGHVSAAYVHRQREKGILPAWYTPKPFKVPGYTRR